MDTQTYESKELGYKITYTKPNEKEIVYNVEDKKENKKYALTIADDGLARLTQDDKLLANIHIKQDKTVKEDRFGQYGIANKELNIQNVDGIMDIYRKIKNNEFTAFHNGHDATDAEKNKAGQSVLRFMKGYIFSTQESREVLEEYLEAHSPKSTPKGLNIITKINKRGNEL